MENKGSCLCGETKFGAAVNLKVRQYVTVMIVKTDEFSFLNVAGYKENVEFLAKSHLKLYTIADLEEVRRFLWELWFAYLQ